MKVQKIVAIPVGTLMLVTNVTPILAEETYSMDTNAVTEICRDNIEYSSNLINEIIDGIEIEKEEPLDTTVYNEVSYAQPVSYTYVEKEIPVTQSMTVDEFMALYGSMVEEKSQEETEAVDISIEQVAYDQALINYNAALAEYEAASLMIENTKEVEVEIVEEVTDEVGNITAVTSTELQTVTELIPAGDVDAARIHLEQASTNLETAKVNLDNAQSQSVAEQLPIEEAIEPVIVEAVQEESPVIDQEMTVKEAVTYASSGKCGDDLTWTLDNNGLLIISGTGPMYNLINPENDNWGTNIKNVIINYGATNIRGGAFEECRSLASVSIPKSVITIDPDAFYSCTSLSNITIPNSVTDIYSSAFYGCTSLSNITIPNSVISIGKHAFSKCTSLTSVTIPESVTSIEQYAFSDCTGLTRIIIPSSVTEFGSSVFEGCTGIKTAGPIGSGSNYEFGWTDTIPAYAFEYCADLTSITFPDSVTYIGNRAFYNCTSLTSITIPDTVIDIGYSAFAYCTGLTSITIPDSVESIGSNAFWRCSGLTDVYYMGTEEEWNEKNLYYFSDTVTIHFVTPFPFTDVSEDAWYYNVAKECYETGLINGTSATTFSPMQEMTRAMVVTILWRMDGQPSTAFNNKFKDVSSRQWYATSISWAVNNGVVNGYGDGTFKPDAAVTREQVAVMLANYATYKGVYVAGTKKLNTYPDGSQVSKWAQSGMKWALSNGIISGNGEGYLRPKKSATRAEGAAMLLRMKNWL